MKRGKNRLHSRRQGSTPSSERMWVRVVRKEVEGQTGPAHSHFTVVNTTLIKALVSRRKERRLIPCVTLLTKAIFPLSSEPMPWVAPASGLPQPRAPYMPAAGIIYWGIWMEKSAEATVQNCNFLKRSDFKKKMLNLFNRMAAIAFWHY